MQGSVVPSEANIAEEQALDALYLGFSRTSDWRVALNAASRLVGAQSGAVLLEYGDGPIVISTLSMASETAPDYVVSLSSEDPILAAARRMPIEDIIRLGDLVDLEEFATSDYFRVIHQPNDVWDVLSIRLADDRGMISVSLFTKRPRTFTTVDAQRAAWFRRHLVRANALRADPANDEADPFLASASDDALTPAEQRVARLLLSGLSKKLIAAKLGISENTVKVHVRNIYNKLGVSSRAELLRRA